MYRETDNYIDTIVKDASVRSMLKLRPLLRRIKDAGIPIDRRTMTFFKRSEPHKTLRDKILPGLRDGARQTRPDSSIRDLYRFAENQSFDSTSRIFRDSFSDPVKHIVTGNGRITVGKFKNKFIRKLIAKLPRKKNPATILAHELGHGKATLHMPNSMHRRLQLEAKNNPLIAASEQLKRHSTQLQEIEASRIGAKELKSLAGEMPWLKGKYVDKRLRGWLKSYGKDVPKGTFDYKNV